MTKGYRHPMRIVFRTDASVQIGTGHVMRCLTLADALHQRGAECTFICRPHTGHLLDLVAKRGHKVIALPVLATDGASASAKPVHAAWLGTDWMMDAQDARQALGSEAADWLVVDHYALDRQWEQALRSMCQRLMVIDDLADRLHDCDLLLDQNLGRTAADYANLLPGGATTLIGPQYALLRPEFALLRTKSLARRTGSQLKRLLITMGGVDRANVTGQVLEALKSCNLPDDCKISVIMGSTAPWLECVQKQAERMPWPTEVFANVSDMAQWMVDADLSIGAAGGTSWERCCLGLPTLLVVLAENQRVGSQALQEAGAARQIDVVHERLKPEIEDLFQPLKLKQMGDAARSITDGQGVSRVLAYLEKTP